MKVFFTASQRGKKYFGEDYKKIYDYLAKFGYDHVDPMIMEVTEKEFYKKLDEKGYDQHHWLYNNFLAQVKKASIIIFESSLQSMTIGYMIDKALELGKPVIILYKKDHLPYFLAGIKDDNLQLVEYTEKNLDLKLKKALEQAKQMVTTRFNFFISKSMLVYLNETSKELHITKSTFIRNLINDHKKSHLVKSEKNI